MYEAVPQELKELNQWVCIYSDSKVPMRAFEPVAASSSDPSSWASFEEAVQAQELGYYQNIGFVFHANGYVGIDIDTGFDDEGLMTPLAVDILKVCGSYTEFSRSGRGFHILLRGKLPFDGKNNQKGVEIYQTGRYFIMTGKTAVFTEIIENQEAIDYIVEKYFPETREKTSGSLMTLRQYNPVWEVPEKGKVKLRPDYPPITSGSRNISMTSLAGTLHNIGYTKGQIYNELLFANSRACDPPLDKRELKSIVNSSTRYQR